MERGRIQNLSPHDIFVQTSLEIPLYELVGIRLFLGHAASESGIDLRGIVVRRDPEGLAIRLIGFDFDTFMLLKKVVLYSADDTATTITQFLNRVNTLEFPVLKERRAAVKRRHVTAAASGSVLGLPGEDHPGN